MQIHTLARSLAASVVVVACAACSGPNKYLEYQKRLSADVEKVQAGQLATAGRDLEALIASTAADADTLKVQRYYAAYLLTEAHVRASLGSPFIKDAQRVASGGIGGMSDDDGSEISHVVATMLWANYAKELAAKAKNGALRQDGVELLPESLRDLSPQAAESALDVAMLVVYARLGFEDRVAKTLDASAALYKLEACEKLLDDARVQRGLRPWVYQTLFAYLRTRDEPAAYKFGVRLLETVEASGGTLSKQASDDVVKWIRSDAKFAFRCPGCNQPIVPELRACQNDQTPHLSFYAELKQP